VTWQEYEQNLETNIFDLHDRIHRGAYRALPYVLTPKALYNIRVSKAAFGRAAPPWVTNFLAVCRYLERNAYTAGRCDAPDQWRCSSLWRWAHAATPEKSLLAARPVPRRPHWIDVVAALLTDNEAKEMPRSISRGVPFSDEAWVTKTVPRLGLESTLHARGRPRKLPKSP
jgi:hypothetical protein